MAKSKTPWLDEGQEAPDPVETATIPAAPGEPSMAAAMMLIAQTLQEIKTQGVGSEHLATIEKVLKHQEEARPHENLFNPPMFSHTNPLGERENPRPELKCKMYWVGYELFKEGLTRLEIDLVNRMQPGSYRVTKADGRRIPFNVQSKLDDAGKIESLTFHFPCKGTEDRQNHNSMVAYLQEALGELQTQEDLLTQIAALKTQLAAQAPRVATGV